MRRPSAVTLGFFRSAQEYLSPGIREKNCKSAGPKPKEKQRGLLSRKAT
jgi:hypothetical protein